MALNKAMIIGNLGDDPELRYTQSGTPVANLSIATNRRWTDDNGQKQEKTELHSFPNDALPIYRKSVV